MKEVRVVPFGCSAACASRCLRRVYPDLIYQLCKVSEASSFPWHSVSSMLITCGSDAQPSILDKRKILIAVHTPEAFTVYTGTLYDVCIHFFRKSSGLLFKMYFMFSQDIRGWSCRIQDVFICVNIIFRNTSRDALGIMVLFMMSCRPSEISILCVQSYCCMKSDPKTAVVPESGSEKWHDWVFDKQSKHMQGTWPSPWPLHRSPHVAELGNNHLQQALGSRDVYSSRPVVHAFVRSADQGASCAGPWNLRLERDRKAALLDYRNVRVPVLQTIERKRLCSV